MEATVDIIMGVGQFIILLVIAFVLLKVGKFVDALAEVIKKG